MAAELCLQRMACAILLICLMCSGFDAVAVASPASSRQAATFEPYRGAPDRSGLPAGFQLVASSPTSLTLELQAPMLQFNTQYRPGGTCQSISAAGYTQNAPPGTPGLLSTGVLLGIPLSTPPRLIIQSMETDELAERVHLCPVPTPHLQDEAHGWVSQQGDVLEEDDHSDAVDAFTPAQPVELAVSGMIRSQRVARLSFSPVLYNPVQEQLLVIRQITLHIQLGDPPSGSDQSGYVDEGAFEHVLQKLLFNYSQARGWRSAPQAGSAKLLLPAALPQLPTPMYKVLVDRDGIYQLTYSSLQSAGLPVQSLDPRSLRLFNQGLEIPVLVVGEDDGTFDPADYLLFYGQKIISKFTAANVYWLTWAAVTGKRMAVQDGTVHEAAVPPSYRATVHLEQNRGYVNRSPSGLANDHWYWTMLNAYQAPIWRDFTFSLQDLTASSSPAVLRGLFKGYFADPQHHPRIYLNSHLVDDHSWPPTAEYTFDVDFPSEYLVEGTNTLSVELPFDAGISMDQVLVNWFELEYDHTFTADHDLLAFDQPGQWKFVVSGFTSDDIGIFETSDAFAPIRILGGTIDPLDTLYRLSFEQQLSGDHRYTILTHSSWLTPLAITVDSPSELSTGTNAADYLIISPAEFIPGVQPVASYYAGKGLRVKVVDVQDIYDEFNAGVFDPQAIQDFLSYAYSHWSPPAPAYVLLVGDGHYDFQDYLGGSGPNYIPPFLGEFDPWIGETAADNRFVTISGDDILPDMFIGRLPVNTISETIGVVDKILSYNVGLADQDWNSHLSFVADDADSAGNFPVLSDEIADNYPPSDYRIDKIYYGHEPYTATETTRAAITTAINTGRLVVSYNGHGSVQNWASEDIFSVDDIVNFANAGKYPFFTPLTCLDGYFIFPKASLYNHPSLAESLVVASGKGAIASWSPSGFGLSNGHRLLAQGLFQALFVDGLTQFGQAAGFAKYYLAARGSAYHDLIDTYNLFGDPAQRLKAPPAFTYYLPLVVE